jgi:hypothetical protein
METGRLHRKEAAKKVDTQLSFQAPLPEEWRMWCVCLSLKYSYIVFGEERGNLNTSITFNFPQFFRQIFLV